MFIDKTPSLRGAGDPTLPHAGWRDSRRVLGSGEKPSQHVHLSGWRHQERRLPGCCPCPIPCGLMGPAIHGQHNSRNEEKLGKGGCFSLPCIPTIFRWFDFTPPIPPRLVPNKRYLKATAPKHSFPLKRDCVNSDAAVSFLHGAALCPCLETDCSLGCLKISSIIFSRPVLLWHSVMGKSLLLALKNGKQNLKLQNFFCTSFFFFLLEKAQS